MSSKETFHVTNEIALIRAAQAERSLYLADILSRAGSKVAAFLRKRVYAPIVRRRRYRQQYEQLTHMDDHLLHDLGVSRGEIAYVMTHGRQVDAANTNMPKDGSSAAA